MNGISLIVPVSRWWNLRMKRKIIYKQNVWEYDQFDLFYIYIIPLSLSFSTKFTVFSKGNNLFGCPRRSYDKRDFDRSTCLWMLNYCAWRLSINNYILNFLLEYLELSVLFIQRPFFSSFWWLLDKSTSRKYASFRRCHCGKIFLCCSCLCTVWLCSALPSSLWYILWVLQLVCPSLKEESFNGKKTFDHVWSFFHQNAVGTLVAGRTLGCPHAKTVLPNSFLYSSSDFWRTKQNKMGLELQRKLNYYSKRTRFACTQND